MLKAFVIFLMCLKVSDDDASVITKSFDVLYLTDITTAIIFLVYTNMYECKVNFKPIRIYE